MCAFSICHILVISQNIFHIQKWREIIGRIRCVPNVIFRRVRSRHASSHPSEHVRDTLGRLFVRFVGLLVRYVEHHPARMHADSKDIFPPSKGRETKKRGRDVTNSIECIRENTARLAPRRDEFFHLPS